MDVTPAPISVQLYTLRDACAADFAGVLTRLGDIGFVGVELAGFHGLTPTEFARVAADSGLQVSSGHIGDPSADALGPALDALQAVGCSTAVLAFLPPAAFADLDAVHRSADALNEASAVAAGRGMTLGYHNHFWEFQTSIDGRAAWWHLFDRLDPAVFAELDTYWTRVGGADPVEVIGAMGDRVQLVHVKDGPADEPAHAMVAVGSGVMDVPGVLGAATSARWHIVELDRCDTDMFDAVEASYHFLVDGGLSRGRR